MVTPTDPLALRPLVEARLPAYLSALASLVNIDSGTFDHAGVDHVGDLCEARLLANGFAVERIAHVPSDGQRQLGAVVIGQHEGALSVAEGGRRVMLMAHMDTVFPAGTASARPFHVEGARAHGPGVADDKGGLLAGFTAIETLLQDADHSQFARLTFVCSPDEEIGSPHSRAVIQRLAADHDVALCLEAARANGDIVSARKGMADFEVEIAGRAAHAGIEPEKGINAALEAAHLVVELQALNGRWPGVTCNVGVVQAGTATNVVADRARLTFELRAWDVATFDEALAAAEALVAAPTVVGANVIMRRLETHRPMERTPEVAALAEQARSIAAQLGFEVRDAATGGAADANTTAAAGVPTLDGLGPIGGDDHAPSEWLDLDSVVPRTTLLAALVARLGAEDGASS